MPIPFSPNSTLKSQPAPQPKFQYFIQGLRQTKHRRNQTSVLSLGHPIAYTCQVSPRYRPSVTRTVNRLGVPSPFLTSKKTPQPSCTSFLLSVWMSLTSGGQVSLSPYLGDSEGEEYAMPSESSNGANRGAEKEVMICLCYL